MAASFTRFSRITHACLARIHTHTARQYTALATPTHKVAQNAQPTTAWFAFAAGTAAAAAMAATVMSTTSCAATVPSSPPPMPVAAAPAPSATDGAPKFRPAACPVEAPAGQTYTEVDIGAHARQHRNDGHMIYDTMWGDKKLERASPAAPVACGVTRTVNSPALMCFRSSPALPHVPQSTAFG